MIATCDLGAIVLDILLESVRFHLCFTVCCLRHYFVPVMKHCSSVRPWSCNFLIQWRFQRATELKAYLRDPPVRIGVKLESKL